MGGGSGGGGGLSSITRSRIIIALFGVRAPIPGVFRMGGPARDTVKILERVAVDRGFRDVDELLVSLGKEWHEISTKDAYDILEKECGGDTIMDVASSLYYVPGKSNCKDLLKRYLKGVKECANPHITEYRLTNLKKYCDHNDDESHGLK